MGASYPGCCGGARQPRRPPRQPSRLGRRHMADRREQLVEALDELAHAVAADGGAALYLDDGDGTLSLAAAAGNGAAKPPGLVSRLRGGGTDESRNLALNVPGDRPGVVVLARRSGGA